MASDCRVTEIILERTKYGVWEVEVHGSNGFSIIEFEEISDAKDFLAVLAMPKVTFREHTGMYHRYRPNAGS